jgi:cytochrome b6-f complex iron-sulfur subunit
MNTHSVTRRDFLSLATRGMLWLSGLLGLGGVLRFLSYKPAPPPPKRFEIGPESSFPLGSRTVLPEIPALLVRSQQGFTAISLVCTHLGCTVESRGTNSPAAFVCNCHGSRYDKDGLVTKGPAVQPLATLVVEHTADGNLIVIKG